MWSKFVESLNAGFFQYNSFIHLTQGQSLRTLGYETSQPVDIRISMADIADVTFEMSDVDWIEANLDRLQSVRHPQKTSTPGEVTRKRTMVTQSLISASVS